MQKHIFRSLAKARDLVYNTKNKLVSHHKIKDNYFYFDSYAGKDFNDNPYQIFKYIYQNYPDNYFVWTFKSQDKIDEFKRLYPQENIIVIKYGSINHFKLLNQAKLWIVNYKTPTYFKKKPDTIYIQTWHGIPLKKLGCDIEDQNQTFYRSKQSYQEMCQSYINEGVKADLFITPSVYAKNKLTSAFKLKETQLLKVGYPRNEQLYLYKDDTHIINEIREELKLNRKTILYAPTWRDDSSTAFGYQTSPLLDFDYLYSELKDDYQIIYRPHYLIKEIFDLNKYGDFIIDGSKYSNLSSLMLASDLLITDYSSIYFDYAILNKPIYFYMPDLDKYQNKLRGFYIDINNELPNDYYLKQEELINDIKKEKINTIKWQNFLKHNTNYPLDYHFLDNIVGEINE